MMMLQAEGDVPNVQLEDEDQRQDVSSRRRRMSMNKSPAGDRSGMSLFDMANAADRDRSTRAFREESPSGSHAKTPSPPPLGGGGRDGAPALMRGGISEDDADGGSIDVATMPPLTTKAHERRSFRARRLSKDYDEQTLMEKQEVASRR